MVIRLSQGRFVSVPPILFVLIRHRMHDAGRALLRIVLRLVSADLADKAPLIGLAPRSGRLTNALAMGLRG
jgi:hypothetical protein